VAAVVLIDATSVPANRRGVGRYVDGLIGALEGDFAIACQARDADYYRVLAPRATVLPQHRRLEFVPLRLVWEQLGLPGVARRAGAQVIHSPHYTLPLFTRRKRVVTFHDATFFSEPQVHTPLKRVFFRFWIRASARLADAIIADSKATAAELTRFVRRPRGYSVAYLGVDPTVFHPPSASEIATAREEFGFGHRPWIAYLGTIEPRKNLPELVKAYRALVGRWADGWGAVPSLALAGGAGWGPDLQPEIDLVSPPGEVRQLGFIAVESVRAFLGGAIVVAYPSLGEGFGLPVLEGMSCGAAVLTTRRLALPEVGGDAVAYTEVDAESIASALESLVSNQAQRTRLGELGLARSREFTWAKCAAIHRSVFEASALH